jgi:hypothetical protein
MNEGFFDITDFAESLRFSEDFWNIGLLYVRKPFFVEISFAGGSFGFEPNLLSLPNTPLLGVFPIDFERASLSRRPKNPGFEAGLVTIDFERASLSRRPKNPGFEAGLVTIDVERAGLVLRPKNPGLFPVDLERASLSLRPKNPGLEAGLETIDFERPKNPGLEAGLETIDFERPKNPGLEAGLETIDLERPKNPGLEAGLETIDVERAGLVLRLNVFVIRGGNPEPPIPLGLIDWLRRIMLSSCIIST